MRDGPEPSHVGIVIAPGRCLHVARGKTSQIESYLLSPFKHRVLGFYRFIDRQKTAHE